MTEMIIRSATLADAPLLADLHRECFPHYWNVDAFNDFFSVAGTFALLAEISLENPPPACGGIKGGDCVTGDLQNMLSHHPHPASPASRGGVNVAMLVCRVLYEQADIMTVAVLPAFRRRGIARALLTQAMEKSAGQGARKIFLDVEDGNLAALQLYETHGFSISGRRKHYYRQKDGSFTDALVMTKGLGVRD